MVEQERHSWPLFVSSDLKIKTPVGPKDLPEGTKVFALEQLKRAIVKEIGARQFWQEYREKEPQVDFNSPQWQGAYKMYIIARNFAPGVLAMLESGPSVIILPPETPPKLKRKPRGYERYLLKKLRRWDRKKARTGINDS